MLLSIEDVNGDLYYINPGLITTIHVFGYHNNRMVIEMASGKRIVVYQDEAEEKGIILG